MVLFALLMVWTSRWTVFEAGALNNNPLNRRTLIDQLRIKRGRILADDNSALAKSVPAGGGTWTRTYPTGSLFAQAVGYSNISLGSAAGLERTYAPRAARPADRAVVGVRPVRRPPAGRRRRR